MGTQSILLLVLCVVLIAIALNLGIHMFHTSSKKNTEDLITLDLLYLSMNALKLYLTPTEMGGYSRNYPNNVHISDLEPSWENGQNEYAKFNVQFMNHESIIIRAQALEYEKMIFWLEIKGSEVGRVERQYGLYDH